MTAFPSCIGASFNRMEYFLQLHATWRRVSCKDACLACANKTWIDFPSATLPRVGAKYYYAGHDVDNQPFLCSEKLRLGRVLKPCIPDWTTCRVDSVANFHWGYDRVDGITVSPSVRAQFLGADGNILVSCTLTLPCRRDANDVLRPRRREAGVSLHSTMLTKADIFSLFNNVHPQILDGVIVPSAEPLMRFPAVSALDYVLYHPHMRNFSCLLVRTGLAPFLALAPLYNEHLLQFIGDNVTQLGCLCRDVLGADVSPGTCRAILRFLYNMFHSITLFAPLDEAFSRLQPGLLDFLFDPANVELTRYILLVRIHCCKRFWQCRCDHEYVASV